jgi:hypothetical protein
MVLYSLTCCSLKEYRLFAAVKCVTHVLRTQRNLNSLIFRYCSACVLRIVRKPISYSNLMNTGITMVFVRSALLENTAFKRAPWEREQLFNTHPLVDLSNLFSYNIQPQGGRGSSIGSCTRETHHSY